MRAVGDPLFLKQTYGNGYQVGMLVNVECIPEVSELVRKVLPGSALSADAVTGVLAVGVVKEDLGGLARLFQWLEVSRRAKLAVREWGISNTTLEQVFLMLCVQNTEVNYVDPGRQTNENQHALCPMCRTRYRSSVIVRVWPPAPRDADDDDGENSLEMRSPLIALADSVCSECARGNKHYFLTEAQAQSAVQDTSGSVLASLIESAASKAEMAKTEAMLSTFEEEKIDDAPGLTGNAHSAANLQDAETEQLLPPPSPAQTNSAVAAIVPYNSSVQGTAVSQVCRNFLIFPCPGHIIVSDVT